jgi:hypothetical protein
MLIFHAAAQRSILLACFLASPMLLAHAAPGSPMHPWQRPTPLAKSEAYFTNLADGDTIETPFLLKFGLSGGWGLAPVAKPGSAKSGHHHLLVNRELPMNFVQALPFNDQYIHFGGGQMETVLTFAPGTYTLRMLLANQKHLPYFVYSKPATITVTRKNSTDPKSLVTRGISMMVDPQPKRMPFRVQFHASDLKVGQHAQGESGTGHFALKVASTSGNGTADLDFPEGQTEVYLMPPSGSYNLTLAWIGHGAAHSDQIGPATATVTVP